MTQHTLKAPLDLHYKYIYYLLLGLLLLFGAKLL